MVTTSGARVARGGSVRAMQRLVAITACAALAALSSAPARAAEFSVTDGGKLGPGVEAVHVWVGVPTLGVRYLAGQEGGFDFGYGADLDYLKLAIEPVMTTRFPLAEGEEFNLALTGEIGFHLDFGATYALRNNVPNTGLRLTPGISVGMKPHPSTTSIFTLRLPFLWSFGYGMGYQLPILLGMGLEYAMTPELNFVAYGALGPRFEGGGGYVGRPGLEGTLYAALSFQLF